MDKFSFIERFIVKTGYQEELERIHSVNKHFRGRVLYVFVKTGEFSYCGFSVWDSEKSLVNARPQMNKFQDTYRGILEEISSEQDVADQVSGTVIFSKGIWEVGNLSLKRK